MFERALQHRPKQLMTQRNYRRRDRLVMGLDALLGARRVFSASPADLPADLPAETSTNAASRRESARLMRVNHTGEVCAQALYLGQAVLARDETVRALLDGAAREEERHLHWCAQRLQELDSLPSRLNPVWFAGAYAIGLVSALPGDRHSLGFLEETERQVVEHLEGHLDKLRASDRRSRAIVERMQKDEAAHASNAARHGAIRPPAIVRGLMRLQALVMKQLAARV